MCPRSFLKVPAGQRLHSVGNPQHAVESHHNLCQSDRHGSFCKKIRDDKGYWEQVDIYLHKYSEADISHGICPECMKIHYPEEYASIDSDKNKE